MHRCGSVSGNLRRNSFILRVSFAPSERLKQASIESGAMPANVFHTMYHAFPHLLRESRDVHVNGFLQPILPSIFLSGEEAMPGQPVIIKIWCREEDLQHTAGLVSWTVGHRIEIPVDVANTPNTYFFVIIEVEQYDDENAVRKSMGFD